MQIISIKAGVKPRPIIGIIARGEVEDNYLIRNSDPTSGIRVLYLYNYIKLHFKICIIFNYAGFWKIETHFNSHNCF